MKGNDLKVLEKPLPPGGVEGVLFDALVSALRGAWGKERALTLSRLAEVAGVSRREVELCVEAYLEAFPFVVVSGGAGLWRPLGAEEVNAYLGSLRSRLKKLARRAWRVRRLASESGFVRGPGGFVDAPAVQCEFGFCLNPNPTTGE
jgi:hypothetical protein